MGRGKGGGLEVRDARSDACWGGGRGGKVVKVVPANRENDALFRCYITGGEHLKQLYFDEFSACHLLHSHEVDLR